MRGLSTVRMKGACEPPEAAKGSGGVTDPTSGTRPGGLRPQARGVTAAKSVSISTAAQRGGIERGADQPRILKTGEETAILRQLSGRIREGQVRQVALKKVAGGGIQACQIAAASFTTS